MKKIAIVGFKGKMGALIYQALEKKYDIIGIDKENNLKDYKDIGLVIDFSSGSNSVVSAEYCLEYKIPIIIGATGQTIEENNKIDIISKQITVIKKSNFSVGFELLKKFVDFVIQLKPNYFEIIEKHHLHKKDKPSGTALSLKDYITENFHGQVLITSIREGTEMGEHKIVAHIKDETISIQHNVISREAFVCGVVKDVEKLF